MPRWCMSRASSRVRTHVHSRVRGPRSPAQQYNKTPNFIQEAEEKSELSNEIHDLSFNSYLSDSDSSNKVVVVVDPSREAKGALDWALSHTVQSKDTLILLHVVKKDGKMNGEIDEKAQGLLRYAKNMCQQKRPDVHVEMAIRDGKEKGATIVDVAKRVNASLLVMGHRKPSLLWRIWISWTSKMTRSKVVDYCIQNASCMTIAVRRKNKKYGGYLITTKRHKNFWLLA